jgi:RHS repeat-associated protein
VPRPRCRQDGESGLRDYDVAYKAGESGTWTAWLTHTTQTQAPFVGEAGQSYTFRVQATDNVSNTSAWVEAGPVTVSAVTKYYYHGNQRVAMRQGDVVYFIHGDHLGSTSLTTDQSGAPVAETRYLPYGEERWTSGGAVSDYTFTGQRADSYIKLVEMGARWYDPQMGRWISPDSIIPNPANPQSLNRYSYVYNNSLRYKDPSGHCVACGFAIALAAAYVGGRGTYEGSSLIVPGAERLRRDQVGGQLVTDLTEAIGQQSAARGVDATVVNSILRHEGSAFERRLLTALPSMKPGTVANNAEYIQALLQGDAASIGPGQMQLRRARELEELGYVTPRANDRQRAWALLNDETSVEYVAGMTQYLSDQLQTLPGYSNLDAETQDRLILIGYNRGWESWGVDENGQAKDYGLKGSISEYGFLGTIEQFLYDNETLDEYLRWSSGQ